jgi:hypothetical protein
LIGLFSASFVHKKPMDCNACAALAFQKPGSSGYLLNGIDEVDIDATCIKLKNTYGNYTVIR